MDDDAVPLFLCLFLELLQTWCKGKKVVNFLYLLAKVASGARGIPEAEAMLEKY